MFGHSFAGEIPRAAIPSAANCWKSTVSGAIAGMAGRPGAWWQDGGLTANALDRLSQSGFLARGRSFGCGRRSEPVVAMMVCAVISPWEVSM
jgi:hypothetical protein